MSVHKFFSFLKERVHTSLPGLDAQLRMAPSPLDGTRNYRFTPDEKANVSSVMILLFTDGNEKIKTILTLRTNSITHGGQISFPGGLAEPGEDAVETALREMEEEIGVSRQLVSVAGNISRLYLQHSNHMITPVIGFHELEPDLSVNPSEVREAFAVSLDMLVGEEHLKTEPWELRDKTYQVPFWNIHKVPLWGATAMMMSELLELYREFLEMAEDKKTEA